MLDSPYRYLKLGLIHFMAYPEVAKGEGPILETLTRIAEDDFFTAVEVSWIKDERLREKARNLLKSSHLTVAYGAQPRLLTNKLNLNSLAENERKKAVDEVKEGIAEASYLGAEGVAVLSGPDPGSEKREAARKVLIDSLIQLAEFAAEKGLGLVLESFDREIDKKCLIGSARDAVRVAEEVRKKQANFGLLLDLSHFPLQFERTKDALEEAKEHLVHVHVGNCVLKDKSHPAYGDQHPRFGIARGENDTEELRELLQGLFVIGFLGKNRLKLPIVSFEVKPLPGESPAVIIANSKRVFKEAWAQVRIT